MILEEEQYWYFQDLNYDIINPLWNRYLVLNIVECLEYLSVTELWLTETACVCFYMRLEYINKSLSDKKVLISCKHTEA